MATYTRALHNACERLAKFGEAVPMRIVTCVFISIMVSGCVSVDLASLLSPDLEEHVVVERRPGGHRGKVLLVDVSGIISSADGGFFSSYSCSPDVIKRILNKAEDDHSIRAVVLRIDSPGGEVTASDLIYREVLDFRRRTGIPVYSAMMGLACSGGYYISCAAERLYAHPTTVTGSIGIIARFPKLYGLAEKIGYDEEILTSGQQKSMGHPLREMSPETRQILQQMIDEMYTRFLDVVSEHRPAFADVDAVRAVADGRIYTASQAAEMGLVDEIGYLSDVIEAVSLAAGISGAKVISYARGSDADTTIYSSGESLPNLHAANRGTASLRVLSQWYKPGFYYLWAPGVRLD